MAPINTSPVAKPASNLPAEKEDRSLTGLIKNINVRKRFDEMLGNKSAGFLSSLLSLYNNSKMLQECDPMAIIAQGAIAASLDLPINSNLGFAAIVPYRDNQSGRTVPQFQMMWRGFVQLALRTGQYKNIHASDVYEDELESWNPLTGELKFTNQETWKQRESGKGKIVGYLSFFRLLNGFEKYWYMTMDQVMAHGKKYSKSFQKGKGRWATDFDVMAIKTPLKLLLSKFGPMSVDLQKAIRHDQAVIEKEGDQEKLVYPDNPNDVIDAEELDADTPKEIGDQPAGDAQEPVDDPAPTGGDLFKKGPQKK